MKHALCKHKKYGFTLLELLVVAAIIAVFAAFAIPGYINYVTQTKVNALWQQAEAAKLAVEHKYINENTSVSSITVNSGAAEYTTSNTDFVKCITVQNGVVSVEGDPAKFNSLSIWIAWKPTVTTGLLSWSCTYSTDAAPYMNDISNNCAICVQVSGACPQPFATDPGC